MAVQDLSDAESTEWRQKQHEVNFKSAMETATRWKVMGADGKSDNDEEVASDGIKSYIAVMASSCLKAVPGSFPPYCCIIVGWYHSYVDPEEPWLLIISTPSHTIVCAGFPISFLLNFDFPKAQKNTYYQLICYIELQSTSCCTPILPVDVQAAKPVQISYSLNLPPSPFILTRNWVTVHSQRSTSLHDFASAVKSIGPPIGARRLKRIQAIMLLLTKTQPSCGTKACHPANQPAVATRSCDTTPENDESSLVAQSSTLKPCPQCSSQGLTTEEHEEQYLNSFCTKMVVLKDGTKLDQHTALEQLHKGAITVQDIDIEDGCEQSGPLDMSLDAYPPDEDDHHECNEEDEWAIENVMQSEHADVLDLGEVNHANDAEDEHAASPTDEPSDSDWSATERCRLKHEQTAREILTGNYDIDTHPSPPDFPTSSKDAMDIKDMVKHRKPKRKSNHILTKASEAPDLDQEDEPGMESNLYARRHGRLPLAAIKKAQKLGKHTTQEAQAIVDEYGKTLASIMAAAGLMMKATQAE
ncbi:hypothetical protein EDD16DRAFT_1524343 [Pisolithus croceorrhizus]|nr:hypothetical protein EDD16DRAFT_1524343 [Pisolithus croceorrhizus]KAI6169195.1 hypothetical protein EDD17DRAFT_1503109 [Pisolithus thermaeus]